MGKPNKEDMIVILTHRMKEAGHRDWQCIELEDWARWLIEAQYVTEETLFMEAKNENK